MASPFDTLFGGSTSYTPSPGGLPFDWMLDPRRWLEEVSRLQSAQVDASAPPVPVAPVRPSPPPYSAGSIATPEADSLMAPSAFTGVPPVVATPPQQGIGDAAMLAVRAAAGDPFAPPSPGAPPSPPGAIGKPPGAEEPPAPPVAPPSLGLTPGQALMPGVGVGGAPVPSTLGAGQPRAPGGPVNIPSFIEQLIQIESGGDPTRLSPSGRYRGLGQFSRDLERQYGITDWTNPDQQRRALGIHVQRIISTLTERLGRPPTAGEIYLAHQQGMAGAPSLLTAPPGTSAFEAIRPHYGTEHQALTAIFNNIPDGHPLKGGLRTLPGGRLPQGAAEVVHRISASDFASLWTRRFDGQGAPTAPPGFTPTGYTPGAGFQGLADTGMVGAGLPPSPGALSALGVTTPGLPTSGPPRPSTVPVPYAGAPVNAGPRQGSPLAQLFGVTPPSVATSIWDRFLGAPAPNEVMGDQQRAQAAIVAAGQRLRLENPDAQPDALMRMLMRDPVWGQHAMSLGPSAPAALRMAISPPPPQEGGFTIGNTRYDAHGRPVVTGTPQAPDQQRVAEWLLSLGPEERAQALAMIRPGTPPSDREQAISRIEQSRTRGMPASIHDLNLAGYLVRVPHLNAAGATIGERVFDMYSQRYLTPAEGQGLPPNSVPLIPSQVPGQPPAPPGGPGAPGAVPGPPPPVAAPGAPPNLADAGVFTPSGDINPPITPSRLQEFQEFLAQHGGVAPNPFNNPMSPFNLFAGMSRQIDGSEAQAGSPGQRPARTPPTEVGPPPSTVAGPRVFRTQSGREYIDVPELSLKSVLVDDPTDMFTGVGVAEAATRAITRGTAQIPGQAGSGEAAQTRGVMLDRLRAAVSSYQEGVRLAGEHSLLIATVPSSSDLWSNPVRALAQAIELRRQVVEELATMIDAGRDQTTSEAARSAANLRTQRLRSILRTMPTMDAMIARRERLISGEENPRGVDVQGLTGDITKGVGAITGGATGAPKGSPSLFNSERPVTSYSPSELSKILDRPNISTADALAIQDEMLARIRRGRTKTGN